jgi:hypothetical protein
VGIETIAGALKLHIDHVDLVGGDVRVVATPLFGERSPSDPVRGG